ncbi:unnamed protein product [Rhizoctonia solani]|uniref:CFEM domain-containing protein n=1 Tax=Rhizoctonia solani TaxID=456999 RepID=A0A8H3B8R1_9AGAM|nr:unnamed protein product [Rhizoctonia solani]
MRIASILALTLAMRVVAQSASTTPDVTPELSTRIISTESEPPVSHTPTPTISDPGITETTTSTTTTPPTSTSTAPPPIGGGATCVQSCLAKAATQAGCKNSADVPCICQSGVYINTAQGCFSTSACENADVQSAIGDYGTVCRNGNPSSESNQSSRSISSASSRTRRYSGSLSVVTTQTLVVTSGAVITLSGGSATTVSSGFTTTRTGQAGDFATGGPFAPEPGATEAAGNGAAGNGAPKVHPVAWNHGGILVALGVVGGALVLVL